MISTLLKVLPAILLATAAAFAGSDTRTELTISGTPGMEVAINGKATGKAPLKLLVSPGGYLVKFSAPGCVPVWRACKISGQQQHWREVLAPARASVLIASDPSGAEVTIGDRVMGVTPLVLPHIQAGTYSAQLKLRGYAPMPVDWVVADARPRKILVNLKSNTGFVTVRCSADNAQIFIDGKTVGSTGENGVKLELDEGRYKLKVVKAGYSPAEKNIDVVRNRDLECEIKLFELPGGVSISSSPEGAEVFVNGDKRGVTPYVDTEMPPGNYTILLKKPGYDDQSRDIQIAPNSKDALEFTLLRSTGELELDITPAGVKIMIDGIAAGVTEAMPGSKAATKPFVVRQLAPGEHKITLTHPRAKPQTRTLSFNIEKGKLLQPKTINVWVANCEITYITGDTELVSLISEDENFVSYAPEPGVRLKIDRSKVKSLSKFAD
ncbi:MAG: PEGA domain-containing protein [Victivallaceae bacterium]|nr:PEGA domain-containing protein [Victivallaceae bacterium]